MAPPPSLPHYVIGSSVFKTVFFLRKNQLLDYFLKRASGVNVKFKVKYDLTSLPMNVFDRKMIALTS